VVIQITEKDIEIDKKNILKGICLGIANSFKINVTLVRLTFVFLSFINGTGILIYIFIWVFAPEKLYCIKD